MKKTFLIIAILFISAASFAQAKQDLKLNEETNLVEATYYHDNGAISQEGTFNLERKLHGEWVSYNNAGKIITVGSYENGKKTGKWLFWANDILKEVEYNDNTIATFSEAKNTEGIVHRD